MAMPFQITSARDFAASHQLRLYDGSLEPLHGHNWRIQVRLEADALDSIGVVMDFHELEDCIDRVVGAWDNRHLNEVPEFAGMNPSAENVAFAVARGLELPPGVRLVSVEAWETPENSAIYLTD